MKRKKIIKILKVLRAILFILFLMSLDGGVRAQPGMPPGHGQNGDQGAGGFAPLGEGVLILLAGAVAYGVRKMREAKKQRKL